MSKYYKTSVPKHVLDRLAPIRDDDRQVKNYGVDLAISMCTRLIASGLVPGLYFYTLNLERSVRRVLGQSGLGLADEASTALNNARKLPWRPSSLPKRADEDVRPIFWANRPHSYLYRTDSWDEFPNGRWGDSRSPAFGDLSTVGYYCDAPKISREERLKLWGVSPKQDRDVFDVFARYVDGDISVTRLPWCEQALHLETGLIKDNLVKINRLGFLTINSQPCVNGASSEDPLFGWGGPGGYVYQKAYVELFCSPDRLNALMLAARKFSNLTYHAADAQGNTYSNCTTQKAAAVTWGVFPNREVQQPTVVDPASFLVWKDEAFALWRTVWASIYDGDSPSWELLGGISGSYFLVNIVDNDFVTGNVSHNGLGIFAVFDRAQALLSESNNETCI